MVRAFSLRALGAGRAAGGARAQVAVLIIGLLATILSTMYAGHVVDVQRQAAIERIADRIAPRILSEFEAHFALIRGAAGFIAASDTVDAHEFARFAEIVEIATRYQSTQGLGFARIVDGSVADGSAKTRVVLLEPHNERNVGALGYDMWSNDVRREAMQRAAETGGLAATGVVTLVQELDARKQPRFLVYFPVYRDGVDPRTVEARRAAIVGWSYMPFQAWNFFSAIGEGADYSSWADYVIRATADSTGEVLFSTLTDPPRTAPSIRTLLVAGQEWRVEVYPNAALLRDQARLDHWLIPLAGVLATALLTIAVATQGRALARAREAEALARQARERTELLMREMNHRIANSLQIAGAMAALQARYLSDPSAKEALAMTRDRIAAIAQVHRRLYTSHDVREVQLTSFLSGLVEELKRTAGESVSIAFEGAEGAVSPDRAVSVGVAAAELIGNALKYGRDAGGRTTIRVRLHRQDEAFVLGVGDDGPGHSGVQGTGLGHRIVGSMASALNGTFETNNRLPGFEAILRFPIDEPLNKESA
jgi:two-component sensor histidine kinase/CHASE1-domain containing sensor protein